MSFLNTLFVTSLIVSILNRLLFSDQTFSMVCRIDPYIPNMPIVYASEAFLKLTGG